MLELFAIPLVLTLSLLLDQLLGEPKKYHPLVGLGNLAHWLEARMNCGNNSAMWQRSQGILAWALIVIPFVMLGFWLDSLFLDSLGWWLLDAVIVYWAIGLKSLKQHALRVYQCLMEHDLASARKYAGYMVSRDTSELSEQAASRATVESVLENGHDAVVAPLVWYVIGGAPAVVLFRLANTLDAMWGYKSERFIYFGWWAARVDDLLGWIPARVCALIYALVSRPTQALQCWWQQGRYYKSPNAGPVMASGAGGLGVVIGGGAIYHGEFIASPTLGAGRAVSTSDIPQSITLVSKACWLLVGLVLLLQIGAFLL